MRTDCKLTVLVVVVLMSVIAGCTPGGPISVNTGYGPGINFTGLGPNYGWAPGAGSQPLPTGLNDLIRAALQDNLAKAGYRFQPEQSNFWVNFRVARKEFTDASVVAFGQSAEEGSLIVEVRDPSSQNLIWWGIAKAQIQDSDPPELRRKRIDAAVKQLMQSFPKRS